MTHTDITAKTFSANGIFKTPVVDIDCDSFRYANTGDKHHGIQVIEPLVENEDQIKQLCAEISDKMLEIYKLINE